jgi:hypothetical protein
MRATLVAADGVQSARVRDLTSSGAGIVCDSPPPAGADVILKRGDLFVAARVVWADENSAGLEFYREAPLDELIGALQTGGD